MRGPAGPASIAKTRATVAEFVSHDAPRTAVCDVPDGSVEESMRHTVLSVTFALSVAVGVLTFGCSSPPPAANSFTDVYTRVIRPSCRSDYCHYAGVGIRYSALDLSTQVTAYWSLVDQPCMGPSCSQMGTRVIPGDPEESILYQKVSESMPSCGAQMPADPVVLEMTGTSTFSGTPLPQDQQQLIYNWILQGAPNN
jgi:hypothetical protein